MRRWIFALAILCAAAFCWKGALGLVLKASVRWHAKSRIAYRDLRIEGGAIILEDAVAFDVSGGKSAFYLRAEQVAIDFERIRLSQCRITLSSEAHQEAHKGVFSSQSRWLVEIEDGELDWSDGFLPTAYFQWNGDALDAHWKGGGELCAFKGEEGWHLEASEIPLAFFVEEGHGTVSGEADLATVDGKYDVSAHANGSKLLFSKGPFQFGGSFALDWKSQGMKTLHVAALAMNLERLRVSVEEGFVQSDLSELKNIRALATFQPTVGGKWEIAANAALLGSPAIEFSAEGKAFSGDLVEGSCQIGEMRSDFVWRGSENWTLEWERLGPDAAEVLQGFAIDKRVHLCRLAGGVCGGTLANEGDGIRLKRFAAEDVSLHAERLLAGCKSCSFDGSQTNVTDGWVEAEGFRFSGQGNGSGEMAQIEGNLNAIPTSICFCEGDLRGTLGDIQFEGSASLSHLSIGHFAGEIPAEICDRLHLKQGRVESIESGFSVDREGWRLACKMEQAEVDLGVCEFRELSGELHAENGEIDCLGLRGLFRLPYGIETGFSAPRIRWSAIGGEIDLRLQGEERDLCRIVGNGSRERFEIDSLRSHVLGASLQGDAAAEQGRFRTGPIPFWAIESLFGKEWGIEGNICLDGTLGKKCRIGIESKDGRWRGRPAPISIALQKADGGWDVVVRELGPFFAEAKFLGGKLSGSAGGLFSFDFEAKASPSRLDVALQGIKADLTPFGMQGEVSGQGCIVGDWRRFEADFDLAAKHLMLQEYAIENDGPLHVSVSTDGNAFLKGIDCRAAKLGAEAHGNADLVEIDWKKGRWKVSRARVLVPSQLVPENSWIDAGREIDLFGSAEGSFDGSDWSAEVPEGLLPLFGSVCQFKDCSVSHADGAVRFSGQWFHRGKWAALALAWRGGEGTLSLQEGERPMTIEGSFCDGKLSVHSIEGEFGGIAASFREKEPARLVGSAAIDFARLGEWIPPETAQIFQDLEMGAGYELKGTLLLDQGLFEGIFCGKEIDLFGYRFRTLLSQARLSTDSIRIFDLKISDMAGSLSIGEIRIEKKEDLPWTIEMPEFTIRDLRPSLFHKPDKEKGALTPLLVTELKMHNFRGFLEEGKSYRASGEALFINSFKREESVFDIPSYLLGRIIGLDLELLIPVEGKLFFELENGYFVLTELQEAYSEGRRSQFFLARTETPPRMSLRGNLEILVTMKQFVLFALTDAFAISIDGKLSDPQFHLQKKKF